jgi:uncharacterized protein YcgI (DUF1989 family)
MLRFVEDTTGRKVDTLIAACDRWRYEEEGVKEWHRNCAVNLVEAMEAAGMLGRRGLKETLDVN